MGERRGGQNLPGWPTDSSNLIPWDLVSLFAKQGNRNIYVEIWEHQA